MGPHFWYFLLLQIILVHPIPSTGLTRHCYAKTDDLREKELANYPHLKNYLESSPLIQGRLGLLHLVNWQDPVLELKLDASKLSADLKSADLKCRWRMWIPKKNEKMYQKEATQFNDKVYKGNDLHADPCNNRNFHRIIACETEQCVQFWNVIVRPMSKPDFPVQVYYGYEKEVKCSLDFMMDEKHKFHLNDQNPPYIFEWTGPKKCPYKALPFATFEEDKCERFSPAQTCHDQLEQQQTCKFSLDGYDSTEIKITGEKVQLRNGSMVTSQSKSVLQMKKAGRDHDGRWRCIVYDYFGISSHPDKGGSEFLKKHDIIHRGIVYIHCKNVGLSVGIPIAIMVFIVILIVVCIRLCKQCTDYDSKGGEKEEKILPKKSSRKMPKIDTPRKKSNHDPITMMGMADEDKAASLNAIDSDLSDGGMDELKAPGGEGGKRKNKKKRKHKPPAPTGTTNATSPMTAGGNKKET